MVFLYSDLGIPKFITYVSEIILFEIVKPEYFFIHVTECGFLKEFIKSRYTWYAFEPFSGFYVLAHVSLVSPTSGTTRLSFSGLAAYTCVTRA